MKPIRNVSNMIQSLNEIESLRSQLLKTASVAAAARKPQIHASNATNTVPTFGKKLSSASSETHLASSVFAAPVPDMVSSSSSSSSSSSCHQWHPIMHVNGDSGMESQRSDATPPAVMPRPTTKASSIPRPVFPSPINGAPPPTTLSTTPYSSSSSSSRSSPLVPQHHSRSSGNLAHSSSLNNTSTVMSDENVYSGYSRDELVQLLRQLGSENVIIKRQLGSK